MECNSNDFNKLFTNTLMPIWQIKKENVHYLEISNLKINFSNKKAFWHIFLGLSQI